MYHSYALSNALSLNASCSECGSSIMNKSAPRPVTAAPTPAAKYSPPLSVCHLPAPLLSSFKFVSGNTSLYAGSSIRSLTLRPKRTASSVLCVACIILSFGLRPKNQAGIRNDANSDLECRGGMLIMRRLSFPCATSSSFSAITLWCRPSIKFSYTW